MTERRKFICEMVENYKRDMPEDFEAFKRWMEYQRGNMADKSTGKLAGASEVRLAGHVPANLMNVLQHAMGGSTVQAFGEAKGEMKWFFKKFPEFLLSRSY